MVEKQFPEKQWASVWIKIFALIEVACYSHLRCEVIGGWK